MAPIEITLYCFAASSLVIATAPQFWSIKGAIAICAVLIFAGWFTDWILVKRHKDAVFSYLSGLRTKLAETSVREWQLKTADGVINLWLLCDGLVSLVFNFTFLILSGRSVKSYYEQRLMVERPDRKPLRAGLIDFFKRGVVFLLLMALWWIAIFTVDIWLVKVSAILAASFTLGVPAAKIAFETEQQAKRHIRRHSAEGAMASLQSLYLFMLVQPFYLLVALIFLSTIFSVTAMAIGCAMARAAHVSSYWFTFTANGAVPSRPFTLVMVNFPFDVLNVALSIALLSKVKKKGKGFMLVALIGVMLSTLITILKYIVLKFIAGNPGSLWIYFGDAFHWLVDLIRFRVSSLNPDWPLTPILLTSFIIVTTYMTAFILIGLIFKPFTRVAGHICEVLGQNKDKTPFLQLSILLSMVLGVIKALGEWDWLVQKWH